MKAQPETATRKNHQVRKLMRVRTKLKPERSLTKLKQNRRIKTALNGERVTSCLRRIRKSVLERIWKKSQKKFRKSIIRIQEEIIQMYRQVFHEKL
jgi:hypothetical protein